MNRHLLTEIFLRANKRLKAPKVEYLEVYQRAVVEETVKMLFFTMDSFIERHFGNPCKKSNSCENCKIKNHYERIKASWLK